MTRTIFATYVSHETVGSTTSGNPIVDVTLRDVHGSERTYRVMHDSQESYGVNTPPRLDVTAYVLTDAGRIRHVDQPATFAFHRLRDTFPVGSTVATLLTHVSGSGMSRRIAVLGMSAGAPSNVTPDVARVLAWKWDRNAPTAAVTVGGAGMDMGFHLVYTLSRRLYGDGYALSHRWI